MELQSIPGDDGLQDAFRNIYVRKIVKFLLQETDQFFFEEVLRFLKVNFERAPETFEQKLLALRHQASVRPDADGTSDTSSDIDDFIRAIADVYERSQLNLKDLRGAIVELLTMKLVSSHCEGGECGNNYGLVDEEYGYKSPQMDVIVLSTSRQQIEGYSCKINIKRFEEKPWQIESLVALANHGQQRGFRTHVGAVSFDSSGNVLRQLRYFHSEEVIKAYGADNIKELRNNPFK